MTDKKAMTAVVRSDFASLLADVKNRIRSTATRAVLAVDA